ncbi:MAG: DUF551 domain-containing protein [Oscillospiraceae bacterium]|nr:DUF551 domain-containing protein [Oscillospiraceae bacterium]
MAMWNRCAICGRAIPVGELCYGIKNWHGEPTNGDTICSDCLVPENALTLTPPNEWVSVEERLPTDEHPVLVFVGYADTMTGFITTSSYFCFDENPHWQWDGLVRDEQRTLFWMPLPAPPDRRPSEGNP